MKAVVTTFPMTQYEAVAREALQTFDANWPKDIPILINLDCVPKDMFDAINADLNTLLASGREFFLSNQYSEDQIKFYERTKDDPTVSYRFQVCKFSHKVFSLMSAANYCKQAGVDTLIWTDADVITHKPITHEILDNELMPKKQGDAFAAVSYLGRTDAPHSECSFMAFDLNSGGFDIIEKMHDYYLTDRVLQLSGWTDCDVFDAVISTPYLATNLSEGIKGWHVFPESIPGKYMEHRKGARKFSEGQKAEQKNKIYDANNLSVKTKNCLPAEQIKANVAENLKQITKWVQYVKPHDESCVIASAGPGLSYNDMKQWHDDGVKIIAVKHAMERLKQWGIKPWACILLDPRAHVGDFIKHPDPDVIYFVASMVDPAAVKHLLDMKANVVGYHAFVGAGEDKMLPAGTLMVSGGSATATRCIGLLHECLGFKEFHCYGYDLCHYVKPNPNEKNSFGEPKSIEVTLASQTWGHKQTLRTFWTEGQFLAQNKELLDLYKHQTGFKIHMYGHGLAAWQWQHYNENKAWVAHHDAKAMKVRENSLSLNEWTYGITGREPTARNNAGTGTIDGWPTRASLGHSGPARRS